MVSPPSGPSGLPHGGILAAARVLGLTNVYAAGGAQAIAALAYGTEAIPKVDKVVGPGSAWVTTAKRLVYGDVDIGSLAGPSAVVILADALAIPLWVAHNLLVQAEHDVRSRAILVTPCRATAEAVRCHVERLVPCSPRRAIVEAALRNCGAIIVTVDLDAALDTVNALAPEPLELMVEHPWSVLERVRHGGAVFVGPWSPEPVGDYYAGPNHVLSTGGTARYASALGVEDFVRRQSVIAYSRDRLLVAGPDIARRAQRVAAGACTRCRG